jgi:hypothetical protein
VGNGRQAPGLASPTAFSDTLGEGDHEDERTVMTGAAPKVALGSRRSGGRFHAPYASTGRLVAGEVDVADRSWGRSGCPAPGSSGPTDRQTSDPARGTRLVAHGGQPGPK